MTKIPSDLVAANLHKVRQARGWSAKELAARCAALGASELPPAVIANIETGRRDSSGHRRRDVTVDELLVVALALDVPPVKLLGPNDADSTVRITPDVEATTSDLAEWVSGKNTILPSLLGGIALCGTCKHPVMGVRKMGRATYLCVNPDCPGPRIDRDSESIDAYVSARTVGLLSSPEVAGHDVNYDEELHRLDEKVEDLRRRRAQAKQQLAELAAFPQLTVELVARSLASFDQEIEQLEADRRRLQQQAVLWSKQGMLGRGWKMLPLTERRKIISAAYEITLVASPEGEAADERASGQAFCPEDIQMSFSEDL